MATMQGILISILLMSGMVTGYMAFGLGLTTQTENPNIPNVVIPDELEEFNRIDETLQRAEETNEAVENALEGVPVLGDAAAVVLGAFGGVFGLVSAIPNSFNAMLNYLTQNNALALPVWAVNMMMGIVTVTVIFIILKLLSRGKV